MSSHRRKHGHRDMVSKDEYDELNMKYKAVLERKNFYKDELKKSKSISDEDVREHALFKALEQKCQELQAQVSNLKRENAMLQTQTERLNDLEWRYKMITDIVQEQKDSGRITD